MIFVTKELSKIIDIESALKVLNDLKIKNLEPEQIKKLFEKAAEKKAINEILSSAKISGIDINKEIDDFLKTRKSKYTQRTYSNSIKKWLFYCHKNLIDPRNPGSKDADLYASYCREKQTASTANININAVSSFYTFIQKHHKISSPFIRVERSNKFMNVKNIPTQLEIDTIKSIISEKYHSAIDAMTLRGFRIGSLTQLQVKSDQTFLTYSKGKVWTGRLPDCLILPSGIPFDHIIPGSIQKAFQRASKALQKAGKIEHVYSVHDLRHFYACNEYKKSNDLYRLKIMLNHDNINTTIQYLKSLNIL